MSVIDDIIRDVAELPGRSSPADWPEAMLVTGDELREIIQRRVHLPVDDRCGACGERNCGGRCVAGA